MDQVTSILSKQDPANAAPAGGGIECPSGQNWRSGISGLGAKRTFAETRPGRPAKNKMKSDEASKKKSRPKAANHTRQSVNVVI
jgi:hypothetical protein